MELDAGRGVGPIDGVWIEGVSVDRRGVARPTQSHEQTANQDRRQHTEHESRPAPPAARAMRVTVALVIHVTLQLLDGNAESASAPPPATSTLRKCFLQLIEQGASTRREGATMAAVGTCRHNRDHRSLSAMSQGIGRLPANIWAEVVKTSALVSMDLVVRDPDGHVLVGWRVNQPAKNTWFVPGGAIQKNETLAHAHRRISREEIGEEHPYEASTLLGVHEHFFDENFVEDPTFGTHYVVVVRELRLARRPRELPKEQHQRFCWLSPSELLARDDVHEFVKRYLR